MRKDRAGMAGRPVCGGPLEPAGELGLASPGSGRATQWEGCWPGFTPHSDFTAGLHLEQEITLGRVQLCLWLPVCALCGTTAPGTLREDISLLSPQHAD